MDSGLGTILLLFLLVAFVAYLWFREQRYLKKKTSETMSPSVWRDVVKDREEALKKRRLFHEALEKAKKK